MLSKIKYLLIIMLFFSTSSKANYKKIAYDFNFKDLNGGELALSDYKSKVIIVINVASQCGFTSQYEDMQKIWNLYQKKGLVIIGVPSNDFGQQEPGTNEDIKNFCESKFGITFPMTQKVQVKGDNAHPFYKWARENYGKKAIPRWNFHKIIVGKDGKIEYTFTSITNPTSKKFITAIEKSLENKMEDNL